MNWIGLLTSKWLYIGIAVIGLMFSSYKYGRYVEHENVIACQDAITKANTEALELQNKVQAVVIKTTEDVRKENESAIKARDEILKRYQDKIYELQASAEPVIPEVRRKPAKAHPASPPTPAVVLPARFRAAVNDLLTVRR
jgi:hypothetical protein